MKKSPDLTTLIKNAANDIAAVEKAGRLKDAGGVAERVADNGYYYKRKIKELQKELPRLRKLPSRDGMPYVFSVVWSYFKKNGFEYGKSTAKEAFADYDCSSMELDMLKTVIIAAAVLETGLVCEKAIKENGGGLGRLRRALQLMKTVEVTDFSRVYPFLSASERLLEENEEHYGDMTEATKAMYRRGLRKYARAKRMTEKEAVVLAAEEAKKRGCCLGTVLGAEPKSNPFPYMLTVSTVFALMIFIAYEVCPLYCLWLLTLPIGIFALGFGDFCFSVFWGGRPCPAIDPHKLPAGDHTLTVITTLLDGDGSVFEGLEQIYHTNKGNGMYFGVLADLPGADSENTAGDRELIKEALIRLENLKCRFGNRFCLFVRPRSYDGEGKYCGRERKRGAIEDLVKYIRGKDDPFLICEGANIHGVRFLLTLDGDTHLPPEGAACLTGMMLHPLNRPVVKKGKVKRGYGIIQPAIAPCLNTVGKTRFSALLAGVGGIDVYESAAFNRQQSIFGEGVFCGKGIIDIESYAAALEGVLPKGKVLSHDMPEGNILRTRYVSDLTMTDSVPSGVLSYFARLHRWIRGDVQNLALLTDCKQGFKGGKRIIGNILRHLSPVFSLAALLVAGFFAPMGAGIWVCFFATVNLISPVFYTLISRPAAIRFRSRRFFSSVKGGMAQSIATAFFELSALAYKSYVTADATAKALFRLIRGKRLLRWVTAAQAEKKGDKSLGTYIYRCFPSALVGGACFFFTALWPTRLLGLVWFLFPLYGKLLSAATASKPCIQPAAKRQIKERALPIWRFFEENVNESTDWLPPDNIQYSPVETVAYRTSPTNIGLYLLSVAAAEDFDFIKDDAATKRIDKALTAVEALPKWNGHLYNWYSLAPTEVIGGNYVSTVDSGNFCVCLVALSRFLYSRGSTTLARRAEKLFEEADFKRLYNDERNLFALGCDGMRGTLSESCYDLYMSEARSTSYFALAFGAAPLKHWRALGRPIVGSGGHIGMASWSGTAFEFFMPQLFLPLYKDSFIYESLGFALSEQKRFSRDKLWGCSESAFFGFDAEMNYQYKAHGVQSLALTRYTENEMILSPYSVYLTLCLSPKDALKTLGCYDTVGMNGRYGLYEAIDLTVSGEKGTPIQSYMSHHMGMSLIACANACFDDVFVKRFMNHPCTGAFYELLQEKIPVGATIQDAEKQSTPKKVTGRGGFYKRLTEYNPAEPVFHISGKGVGTVIADSTGHVRFDHNGLTVNETSFDRYSTARSLNVSFCRGKEVFFATPVGDRRGKYSFESAPTYAAHICASAGFSGRVKYYTDAAGSFVVETKSDGGKSYALVFSFDVQLCGEKEFYAHPAFNRLFVSAEYDKQLNAVVYTKNSADGRDCLYLAVGLSDSSIAFSFETNKESYGAFSLYSPEDVIKESYTNTTGVCVTPFCLIKTPPLAGGEAKLILSVGHTRKECTERLLATRRMGGLPMGSSVFGERQNPILEGLFCGRYSFARTELGTENALWSRGISGDFPIVAVLVREFYTADIEFYIDLFKSLATLNIRMELVFITCEEDRYRSPIEKAIRLLLRQNKCEGFLGRRGGIFFADGNDEDTVAAFKDVAVCFTESYDTPFAEGTGRELCSPLPRVVRRHVFSSTDGGTKVGGGVYGNGYFTVDKDRENGLPYSYVMAGRGFGSVVTQSTLGYSFCGNAALGRVGAFSGDPYGGTDRGEVLYCIIDGRVYDLAACSFEVRYENGIAVYKGVVEDKAYTLTVFVCDKLPLKGMKLSFDCVESLKAAFAVAPLMGNGVLPTSGVYTEEMSMDCGVGMAFTNPKSSFFKGYRGFAAVLGQGEVYKSRSRLFGCGKGAEDTVAVASVGKDFVFLLGAAPTRAAAEAAVAAFAAHGFEQEMAAARAFAKRLLPPVALSARPTLDAMFNVFAPYQTAACRFYARGAFYQSGGAFGFRDQLQDCLYLLYSDSKAVRTHLIRAAARQYTDGSVQHWWHPHRREGRLYGVRTKCSDDFLWLPLAVAEYVERTGDRGVLQTQIPYLESPPLGDLRERYEAAEITHFKESLIEHCKRALNYGKSYGPQGLPLLGSCDWNDAFSALGPRAESVFCGFLQVIALRKFGAICGDEEYNAKCKREADAMLEKTEGAFNRDRFVRAYNDGGTPLGVDGRGACEIDALVQAFAVFAGADRNKCLLAMKTAYSKLYDRENRLLKLFTPAFGRDTEYGGYINAYAKGVRENGGQYTHAAVWFCAALAICGMKDEAAELLNALNPLWRSEISTLFSKYKAEPYAIAADIYSAKGQKGRGGWTHYTGAAGWFCKTVLEVFMGVDIKDGFSKLTVTPRMEYEAVLEFKGKLNIRAAKGASLSYDGKPVCFPIVLEDGEHTLTVPVS